MADIRVPILKPRFDGDRALGMVIDDNLALLVGIYGLNPTEDQLLLRFQAGGFVRTLSLPPQGNEIVTAFPQGQRVPATFDLEDQAWQVEVDSISVQITHSAGGF